MTSSFPAMLYANGNIMLALHFFLLTIASTNAQAKSTGEKTLVSLELPAAQTALNSGIFNTSLAEIESWQAQSFATWYFPQHVGCPYADWYAQNPPLEFYNIAQLQALALAGFHPNNLPDEPAKWQSKR